MARVARFGIFEADLDAHELRKHGRVIPLQYQPFEVLTALLERPNEVVTREMLRQRLWPDNITVDFDQSLNKSVAKLRDALGDSATHSRFIETVPRVGYRFIATVELVAPAPVASTVIEPATAAAVTAAVSQPSPRAVSLISVVILSALVLTPWIALTLPWESMVQSPRSSRPMSSGEAAIPNSAGAVPVADSGNADAREAYARGQVALIRRNEEGLRSAIDLFGQAVALDPRYDAALAGLADAWGLLASHGMEEPRSAMARAREFANRALTINPDSVEAHRALGRITMIADWNWKAAERHFRSALEIRDSDAITHRWFAYLLSATARHVEAEQHARRAVELEPLSVNAATGLGYVLYVARRFDDAATVLRRVLEIDPDYTQARRDLGVVLAMQERYREAIEECERVIRLTGESSVALAEAAWVYGQSGDVATARRLVAKLRARASARYVPDDSLALALWASGERPLAIATLEKAFNSRLPMMSRLAVDPLFDQMRELPKVRRLAQSVRSGRIEAPRAP